MHNMRLRLLIRSQIWRLSWLTWLFPPELRIARETALWSAYHWYDDERQREPPLALAYCQRALTQEIALVLVNQGRQWDTLSVAERNQIAAWALRRVGYPALVRERR